MSHSHISTKISDAQCWVSECPDAENYKWRLNPVWHRMLYSCTHMATVDVKGLIAQSNIHHRQLHALHQPTGLHQIIRRQQLPQIRTHRIHRQITDEAGMLKLW